MSSTQIQRKIIQQQQKYSLDEKEELGELDKNVSPLLPAIPPWSRKNLKENHVVTFKRF